MGKSALPLKRKGGRAIRAARQLLLSLLQIILRTYNRPKTELVQTSLRAEGEAISLKLTANLIEIASGSALAMTFGAMGVLQSQARNDDCTKGKPYLI
jgi:hypothetical protein